MKEEFYVGQIFEEMYPTEAADWCNTNQKIMVEIEPITKEVEEKYIEIEKVEKEIVIPATDVEPEHIEIVVEETPVEKTRMVEKTLRRFQIQEVPAPSEEEIKRQRISELKTQLNDTDYKIIKCSEYQLAGLELPYDIATLHAQRQAIRDEINELEA